MAFVAVLAGYARGLPSNVSKQSLDIAPSGQVQLLLWPALMSETLAGLACQSLGEGALDVEVVVPGVPREVLGGPDHGRVHRLVAGLHLMRRAHLGGGLVLVWVLVLVLMLVDMLGLR